MNQSFEIQHNSTDKTGFAFLFYFFFKCKLINKEVSMFTILFLLFPKFYRAELKK